VLFIVGNREVVLSLLVKLLVKLSAWDLRSLFASCIGVPFSFVLLDLHDHLKILELLVLPQIIDGLDERLLSHRHNFFTNVLNDIILKAFISITALVLIILKLIVFLHGVRGVSLQVAEQLLILLINSVLLSLDGLDDFVLGFGVIWATVRVAGYIGRVVVV